MMLSENLESSAVSFSENVLGSLSTIHTAPIFQLGILARCLHHLYNSQVIMNGLFTKSVIFYSEKRHFRNIDV